MAGLVVALASFSTAGAEAEAITVDGSRPGDPELSVDPAVVRAAMECRGPLGGSGRESVLLVHGTSVTGAEAYGWNYLPELAARGYRVCTVDLPGRSLGDIQVAAEYVVVAVHRMARESGRKVDILGHSQGALEARWAVRWWPSVAAEVDDVVSLAGPNQGTTAAVAALMPLTPCAACIQMAPGSAFLTALNSGALPAGGPSTTSIYSTLIDELITPNATAARIQGASNVEIQAVCAARVVTHGSIVVDALVFALVLDAFGQTGPASPARVNRSVCLQTTFSKLPAGLTLDMLLQSIALPVGGVAPAAEPALKPYAAPQSPRAVAAGPVAGVPMPVSSAVAGIQKLPPRKVTAPHQVQVVRPLAVGPEASTTLAPSVTAGGPVVPGPEPAPSAPPWPEGLAQLTSAAQAGPTGSGRAPRLAALGLLVVAFIVGSAALTGRRSKFSHLSKRPNAPGP